jgi:hypothetical protein
MEHRRAGTLSAEGKKRDRPDRGNPRASRPRIWQATTSHGGFCARGRSPQLMLEEIDALSRTTALLFSISQPCDLVGLLPRRYIDDQFNLASWLGSLGARPERHRDRAFIAD